MSRASIATSACVTAFVALAVGACSLFVDTDGLTRPDGDAAIESDAWSDAPISSDAKAANDAGSSDASAAPFCTSHPGHALCYDFDESASLPRSNNSVFDPGHLVIDSTTSVSPQNSLLAIYNAGDSNQQIEEDVTSTQGKVSWALDLKFSASDLSTGQTAPLATDVPVVDGLSDHYFYLQTYFNELNVGESASPSDGGPTKYTSTALTSPVPLDVWMHVEFTVDGSTGVITLSFNGSPLPNDQAQYGFPNGAMQVTVGGFSGNLPAPTKIHLDNILVDF